MPGLPPNTAVINPTINAAYKPDNGATPATKAKAIASGTKAKATVKPDKISTLNNEKLNPLLRLLLGKLKFREFARCNIAFCGEIFFFINLRFTLSLITFNKKYFIIK